MITDILGGGKTGAADAASSTKQGIAGRKGADGSAGGFSDALSGFDRDMPSQHADDVSEEGGQPSSAEERMAGDVKQGKHKPIIDIKPESLRRPAEETEKSVGASKHGTAEPEEKQMTPAEKKLREALEAAKAVARKSDEVHGKRSDASKKDAEAETEGAEDLDVSMLVADDAKITDMLSLLSGETSVGEMSAMVSKNATGQQNKRTKGQDDDGRDVDVLGVKDSKHTNGRAEVEGDPLSTPVDMDTSAPDTRIFRFSNARTDQHLDITVGGRGERNTVESRVQSNGAAENVTVLDARRFLGLAPNSNGANLTAMLSGDAEWASAMSPSSALSNAAAQSSTGTVVNTLKLQMNPHDLGSVTATLRLHGEELNVHLTVETRAAYRQLSEDSGGILDALRAQGFAVDQVTISIAPTADSDGTSSQQGQAGQTGQQALAEGGRQGQAAGRGQQQNGGNQAADQGTRSANDAASDNVAGTTPGGARPGQLYL